MGSQLHYYFLFQEIEVKVTKVGFESRDVRCSASGRLVVSSTPIWSPFIFHLIARMLLGPVYPAITQLYALFHLHFVQPR